MWIELISLDESILINLDTVTTIEPYYAVVGSYPNHVYKVYPNKDAFDYDKEYREEFDEDIYGTPTKVIGVRLTLADGSTLDAHGVNYSSLETLLKKSNKIAESFTIDGCNYSNDIVAAINNIE